MRSHCFAKECERSGRVRVKSKDRMPKTWSHHIIALVLACPALGCSSQHTEPVTPVTPTQPTAAGMRAAPQAGASTPATAPVDAGTRTQPVDAAVTVTPPPAAGSGGAGTAASTSPTAGAGHAAVGGSSGQATAGASGAPDSGPSTAAMGAAEDKPLGYGRMATGGGKAQPKAVSTLAELQSAVDAYSGSGGLVLEYSGQFDFKTITDPCVQHTLPVQKLEIKKKSDITLIGKAGSAANFGIHVAADSHNIIIRNMTIGLVPGGGDSDMISLEGMSGGAPRDVWIDHNELFSSLADCPGAGDTAFDGMIDIKKGADNVTISYNYLHDHHKASLNGYSDDDSQPRHVTFHHNVFENIGSRTPLQRHGLSHVLNNEFSKVLVSAVNVRMQGHALVEGNYFQDVKNPVTARDSDEVGFWELRNNNLKSAADVAPGNAFGITWDNGDKGTVNATDWMTTGMFPEALGYDYQAQPFACVHSGLRAVIGPGKKLATLSCH